MNDLRVTQLLPVSKLRPAADNVRENVGDVRELANSIREVGLLTPLLVAEEGDHYILVAGHRRLAAMKSLGWKEIPCVVRTPMNDVDRTSLMLIENTQRVNINPVEKARALKRLADHGLTQTEIAKRTGIHQTTVGQYLRILDLPEEYLDRLRSGKLKLHSAMEVHRSLYGQRSRTKPVAKDDIPIQWVDCDKCGGTGRVLPVSNQGAPKDWCPHCRGTRLCFKHQREKAEADQQKLARLRAKLAREKGLASV